MIKRGEKFPEERLVHGVDSPGVVEDDEVLERRLPPGNLETPRGEIPREAFRRAELKWTEEGGGASVDRSRHLQGGIAGRRGIRSTVAATAGDIRNQTDADGNRLWSVTDVPLPGNPAHAEIQREPRGTLPSKAERDQLMEAWRGAAKELMELKKNDPSGEPKLKSVQETGIEIHWRSKRDCTQKRVIQVSSVPEAVRAFVAAGIVAPENAADEQRIREKEILDSGIEERQCADYSMEPTW